MIFVFDIDGTLCFDGQTIDPKIVAALKRLEKNHKVVFASARPIRDLLPVVVGFEENLLIGGNGAIVSHDGHIRIMEAIHEKGYREILDVIAMYQCDCVIDSQFNYSANIASYNKIVDQLDPLKLASNVEIDAIRQAIKVILLNLEEEDMAVITQRLRSQPTLKVIHHRNENAVDITAKGVDKHSTLRKIIGGQDYVAFGNDANDVEMLEHAKQGYYVLSYEDEVDPKALGLQTVQPTTKAIVETLLQLNEQYTK